MLIKDKIKTVFCATFSNKTTKDRIKYKIKFYNKLIQQKSCYVPKHNSLFILNIYIPVPSKLHIKILFHPIILWITLVLSVSFLQT